MIAVPEIQSAIAIARQQNGSLDDSQLANAVARLFGFQKAPARLHSLVSSLAA
jgi:hypothetical protein